MALPRLCLPECRTSLEELFEGILMNLPEYLRAQLAVLARSTQLHVGENVAVKLYLLGVTRRRLR
jgi:hypothetical protein